MVNSKNVVKTPKSSPIKLNSSPNKSVQSPDKSKQTLLVLNKLKSPSISPKKSNIEKKVSNIKIGSLEKNFNSNDDDQTSDKIRSKRKMSPIKTPENKKFKNNTISSPDTQVSIMIVILCIRVTLVI